MFRRGVVIALVAVAHASCAGSEGEVLRAGHANIAGWAIYEGDPAAGRDLADAILRDDLDVVGVSEACESQLVAAAEALGGHDEFEFVFQETVGVDEPLPWSPPTDSGCRYGNALLVRTGLGLADVTPVELPTLDRGEGEQFDPEEDRWLLCGRVSAGRSAVVCATHLTNLVVTEDVRRHQANTLHAAVEEMRAPGEPAVVVGDFNARNGDPDLGRLAEWTDAARSRGVVHVFVVGAKPSRRGSTEVGSADHDLRWAGVRIPDSG